MAWEDGLRDPQQAVAGSPRGDAVLLAGPGTGKTYVLVRRVQYLIEVAGLSPDLITAVTFTRAAAAEMRHRLVERLGAAGEQVRVSTLHSYALRELLRRGAMALPGPIRIVGDWEERNVVLEELSDMLGRSVPVVKNDLARLADDWDTLAADDTGWIEGYPDPSFLDAWRRHREVYGYTLRSELVYQLLSELRSDPTFAPNPSPSVLLVDEYQDLNQCDLSALQLIAERTGADVFATGDDDQSIYSFRHAHPAGIRGFQDDYEHAAKLHLTECMRCGPDVVALANWLIAQERNREPKELVSVTSWPSEVCLLSFGNQADEAAGVRTIVQEAKDAGTPLEEILILLKTDDKKKFSRPIVEALETINCPTYLPRDAKGTDDDTQRVLAYLILTQAIAQGGTDHLAMRSLLALEDNGVGATRIRGVVDFSLEHGLRFSDALEHLRANPADYPSTGLSSLLDAVDAIVARATDLAQLEGEELVSWIERVCGLLGVDDGTQATLVALGDELAQTLAASETDMVPNFARELIEAMSQLEDNVSPQKAGHVTITTMHGAKGLTADVVIVLQLEDEMLPGGAVGPAIDEARRLLYVSLTRAKRRLFLGTCRSRFGAQAYIGSHEVRRRGFTRFLRDYGLTATSASDYVRQRRAAPPAPP